MRKPTSTSLNTSFPHLTLILKAGIVTFVWNTKNSEKLCLWIWVLSTDTRRIDLYFCLEHKMFWSIETWILSAQNTVGNLTDCSLSTDTRKTDFDSQPVMNWEISCIRKVIPVWEWELEHAFFSFLSHCSTISREIFYQISQNVTSGNLLHMPSHSCLRTTTCLLWFSQSLFGPALVAQLLHSALS